MPRRSPKDRPKRPKKTPTKRSRLGFFKRVLAVLCGVGLIVAVAGLYLLWGVVRREEMAALARGYVETTYEDGEVRYAMTPEMPGDWTPLDTIVDEAWVAIVVSEDWRFFHHHGFDAEEIKNAIVEAVQERKRPRGASTITQQVAKNLFLSHRYSFLRKIKELAIALRLEQAVSKEKILEIYLNTIEYGEGIYGITAACDFYFGETPDDLTPREAAFLATLLPSPKRYERVLREEGLTEETKEKIDRLLKIMRGLEYITEDEYQRHLAAPLTFTKRATTP